MPSLSAEIHDKLSVAFMFFANGKPSHLIFQATVQCFPHVYSKQLIWATYPNIFVSTERDFSLILLFIPFIHLCGNTVDRTKRSA